MRAAILAGLGAGALCLPASSQTAFSIDYGGPTISLRDFASQTPITEGDILLPPTFFPALGPFVQRPGIFLNGGSLGLARYLPCVGHPSGIPCGVEVDAISFGVDGPVIPQPIPGAWWFSVDEYAIGLFGPGIRAPSVSSEGRLGAMEACASVFNMTAPVPPGPTPPPMPPFPLADWLAIDGNGFRSATGWAAPGVGLIEWNPPMPPAAIPGDLGDNIDALDVNMPMAPNQVFFSLDSAFVDPLTGIPNSGSAAMHGFVGGDVLVVFAPGGMPPVRYAAAVQLGLDRFGPPDSDDLDALIVFENGIAGYQPSMAPYDWLGGGKDLVLFSVRRGSLVIGLPDSFFGVPIQEGDILTTPVAGGLTPFPGIFIHAEWLGLSTTRFGPGPFSDDLDALDYTHVPVFDCNGNGVEDVVEIATGMVPDANRTGIPDPCDITQGASADFNLNSIPDEVEFSFVSTYCVAKVNTRGCTPVIGAFGTPSVTNPKPYFVSAVDIVANRNGLLFYGYAPVANPFKGGTKCVANPVRRTGMQNSGGALPPPANCTGVYAYDFNVRIQGGIDPMLLPGVTVYSQYWYRDPGSTFQTGLSDAIQFAIAP